MELLNKALNKVDRLLAYISAATIFFMMIWIFLDAVLRYFFNRPFVGTIEITGEYFLVIIVYFAISYTFKEDEHVSVDLFWDKFSESIKKILRLITNLLGFIIFMVLGINNFHKGLEYFNNGIHSASMLDYPLWPALMIISLGIFLLSIRFIFDSIAIIIHRKTES